eukprot:s735_g19.t1
MRGEKGGSKPSVQEKEALDLDFCGSRPQEVEELRCQHALKVAELERARREQVDELKRSNAEESDQLRSALESARWQADVYVREHQEAVREICLRQRENARLAKKHSESRQEALELAVRLEALKAAEAGAPARQAELQAVRHRYNLLLQTAAEWREALIRKQGDCDLWRRRSESKGLAVRRDDAELQAEIQSLVAAPAFSPPRLGYWGEAFGGDRPTTQTSHIGQDDSRSAASWTGWMRTPNRRTAPLQSPLWRRPARRGRSLESTRLGLPVSGQPRLDVTPRSPSPHPAGELLLRLVIVWLVPGGALAAGVTPDLLTSLLSIGATLCEIWIWLSALTSSKRRSPPWRSFFLRLAGLCTLQLWSLLLHESMRPDDSDQPAEPVQPEKPANFDAPMMRGSKAKSMVVPPKMSAPSPSPRPLAAVEVETPRIARASLAAVGEGNFVVDAEPEDLKWAPRTISVVLPCAEERDLAFKTVKSVFDTTPTDILHEIVVVDDGSNPPLSETHLNADVQKKYKILIKRHDRTVGLIGAKKTGGDAATGDIIVFFDCHVGLLTQSRSSG